MSAKTDTMSPRAEAASARIQATIDAAALERRRSFYVLVGVCVLFSGIAFKDVIQAESVRLVDVLIPVGMTLAYAAILVFAWSRLPRRKEPANG